MIQQKITELTVWELSRKLQAKEISAVEAASAYLTAIKEKEPSVGAYLSVLEGAAMQKAAEVDDRRMKGETLSPLAGVPAGIKDNICTKGFKTTCASRMLENFTAPYDAHVMEQLQSADAVMLGKLNMD